MENETFNPPRLVKKYRKIKDSIPQKILFEELKRRLNPKYLRYNYPVRTWTIQDKKQIWNIRYIDVAYTLWHIAFEYDGEEFHKDRDFERDRELKHTGWKIVHINKNNIQRILDNLQTIIYKSKSEFPIY